MDLTIRPAVEEDAEDLRDYAEQLFGEGLPGIFRRPIPTLEDELQYIRTLTTQKRGTLLIAQVGERIAGMVSLTDEQLEEEAHCATFGISVARDWRGRGVGSRLLEAAIEWAPQHGITRIQGYVWMTNPRALELYERHGFEREGVFREAILRDGEYIDVVAVALLIPRVNKQPRRQEMET